MNDTVDGVVLRNLKFQRNEKKDNPRKAHIPPPNGF